MWLAEINELDNFKELSKLFKKKVSPFLYMSFIFNVYHFLQFLTNCFLICEDFFGALILFHKWYICGSNNISILFTDASIFGYLIILLYREGKMGSVPLPCVKRCF